MKDKGLNIVLSIQDKSGEPMIVEKIMGRDFVYIELPAGRREILQLMRARDVGAVYVVSKKMELKGMVTRKTILEKSEEDQVALIMKRNPISVEEGSGVSNAARLVFENRVHNLPVVDGDKRLTGAIRTSNFLKILEESEQPLSPLISRRCACVYEETPLSIIREIMELSGSHALYVLNVEGTLGGVISEADLFRYIELDESISRIDMGMGEDEDKWTWEGMRDTVALYYVSSKLLLPRIPVKEVMIRDIITVTPKLKVRQAARKMRVNILEQLPVVNANEKLLGSIEDIDLLKVLADGR